MRDEPPPPPLPQVGHCYTGTGTTWPGYSGPQECPAKHLRSGQGCRVTSNLAEHHPQNPLIGLCSPLLENYPGDWRLFMRWLRRLCLLFVSTNQVIRGRQVSPSLIIINATNYNILSVAEPNSVWLVEPLTPPSPQLYRPAVMSSGG